MERHPLSSFSGLLLGSRRLDRAAGRFPGAEAAADMGDRSETHALGGRGRQRRALAGRAEEYETLVLREHRLVILALRVDPEFEHAAWAMEGAGNAAFTIELANVAQVDEYHVGAAVHRQDRKSVA